MKSIEKVYEKIGVKPLISEEMRQVHEMVIALWKGDMPWNQEKDEDGEQLTPSLNIPKKIGNKMAKDIAAGLKTAVLGDAVRTIAQNGEEKITYVPNERSIYLNEQYMRFVKRNKNGYRSAVAKCAIGGTVAYRIFIVRNKIQVTFSWIDNFKILAKNELGEATSIVFFEYHQIADKKYTLWEVWDYFYKEDKEKLIETQTLKYHVTVSENGEDEKPARLKDVPQWSKLEDAEWTYPDITMPWFVVSTNPINNTIDTESPYGMPVVYDAINNIKGAEEQAARISWEYKGTEFAIEVEVDLLLPTGRQNLDGRPEYVMPKGKKRLYKLYSGTGADGTSFGARPFSPDIRDDAQYRRLDEQFRLIESDTNMFYGFLSKVRTDSRTLGEVIQSRTDYAGEIQEYQESNEEDLKKIVKIINEMASYYKLAPEGNYNMQFEWGEVAVIDRETEFKERVAMVANGIPDRTTPSANWFMDWYEGKEPPEEGYGIGSAFDDE